MKNILITGATSGIGLVAACELAARGNKVIATARNSERAHELTAHYQQYYPDGKGKIEIVLCDLSSFEAIVKACTTIKENNSRLDVLINNAGLWKVSYQETVDKIEETFQVNVLAPLLMNHLLIDLLLKSKRPKSIFTASALHQGNVDFENLEFKTGFSGFKAYRQSKLEIILLCRLLAKKFKKEKVGFYCQHPGLVNTRLGRDANWFSKLFFRMAGISPKRGAQTLIYLVDKERKKLVSGEYYYRKNVKTITPQSYDLKAAQRLLDKAAVYLKAFIGSSSLVFGTHDHSTKQNKLSLSSANVAGSKIKK